MTTIDETIDLDDELDYELDVDMDEDGLLESEDDKHANEKDVIKNQQTDAAEFKDRIESIEKQMSLTTDAAEFKDRIESIEKQMSLTTVTACALPLSLYLPNSPYADNNWLKSFSTSLNESSTIPSDEAVEPKVTKKVECELTTKVSAPVGEVISHEHLPLDTVELVKLSIEKNSIPSADQMELDASASQPLNSILENLDAKDSIEASKPEIDNVPSSSSSRSYSNRKRNKNRKKRMTEWKEPSPKNGPLPCLMSINTSAIATLYQKNFRPTAIPTPFIQKVNFTSNQNKKKAFVIEAKTNGSEVTRTVLVSNSKFGVWNGLFDDDNRSDGFLQPNQRNESQSPFITNRKRSINRNSNCTATSGDLRNLVINQRKSIATFDSICQSKEKNEDVLANTMVTTDEMSDEDKEYLKKIEDYKLKRKEFLRQKELKNEGWKFLE